MNPRITTCTTSLRRTSQSLRYRLRARCRLGSSGSTLLIPLLVQSFGFSKYDSTETHGVGPIKVTLDLYDKPPAPTPPAPPGHCEGNEYCCPDAKACLFPTETSCKDGASACGKGEVCCPLTKICVIPRKPCATPCSDTGSYCCPVTKHCVTPTNPGVICHGAKDCQSDEACCPTTKVCVKLGATCTPPLGIMNSAMNSTGSCEVGGSDLCSCSHLLQKKIIKSFNDCTQEAAAGACKVGRWFMCLPLFHVPALGCV